MNFKSPIPGLIIFFFVMWFALQSCSLGGWGYAGYRGFNAGPSFFYWGGARNYYYGDRPSVRRGSTTGSRHLGGSFRAGK